MTGSSTNGRAQTRVLVLARSYPNELLPTSGLWTARPTAALARTHGIRVISPVPYFPPLPAIGPLSSYARFRSIPQEAERDTVRIHHPRLLVGPGTSLYFLEARAYARAAARVADRIHEEFPFDLVHAHFVYPDGAAARRIAERFGVPLVLTEHAPWTPQWMERRGVLREAVKTVRAAAKVVAVSSSVRRSIQRWTGADTVVDVVPVGVDTVLFHPRPDGRRSDRLLFVGFINYMKGIDVLFRAIDLLRRRGVTARLLLVGGAFYRDTQRQERELRALAVSLGLSDLVEFAGRRSPVEVARLMAESAAVVLPSRAESFGAVLVEALACGTPVVATRCGGPEDIVTDDVGVLVPPEDPEALAAGIEQVLDRRETFDPAALRAYALTNFGLEGIAERYAEVYSEALGGGAPADGLDLTSHAHKTHLEAQR